MAAAAGSAYAPTRKGARGDAAALRCDTAFPHGSGRGGGVYDRPVANQPSSDRLTAQLVGLPELIQTIATQRRSGLLVINGRGGQRRLRFANGALIGIAGAAADRFARALVWAGVLGAVAVATTLRELGGAPAPDKLLAHLLAGGRLARDAALDAIDLLIEEEFAVILGWNDRELSFVDQPPPDPWLDAQAALGVSVSASGMLLECLRRQDELKRIEPLLPDPWDVLIREPIEVAELPPDVAMILSEQGEQIGRAHV